MSDKERSEILQLLAKGKISADEAAELLTQVERDGAELAAAAEAEVPQNSDPYVIKVTDEVSSLKAEEAQAVARQWRETQMAAYSSARDGQ